MPNSDDRQRKVADLINAIDSLMGQALKEERLDDVPDDSLGQLFASVVRLYAAKAQVGNPPRPFARNSGITATDVMIGCTAMLEGVNVPLFDLALWQSWSNVGKRQEDADADSGGERH